MKKAIVYFFFIALGILGIFYPISIALKDQSRILLENATSPLLIYAPVLFCIFISLAILSIPLLIQFDVISFRYFDAGKYEKAKSDFVSISITIPAWIFLFITAIYLNTNIWIATIFIVFLLFKYFSSIRVLVKK